MEAIYFKDPVYLLTYAGRWSRVVYIGQDGGHGQ